jgi:hypothetical protein
VTEHVTVQVVAILEAAREPRSREELQAAVGIKHRMHFVHTYLEPLLSAGWLAMTIPDKPRSRNQKYRATAVGLAVLAEPRRESSEERKVMLRGCELGMAGCSFKTEAFVATATSKTRDRRSLATDSPPT